VFSHVEFSTMTLFSSSIVARTSPEEAMAKFVEPPSTAAGRSTASEMYGWIDTSRLPKPWGSRNRRYDGKCSQVPSIGVVAYVLRPLGAVELTPSAQRSGSTCLPQLVSQPNNVAKERVADSAIQAVCIRPELAQVPQGRNGVALVGLAGIPWFNGRYAVTLRHGTNDCYPSVPCRPTYKFGS